MFSYAILRRSLAKLYTSKTIRTQSEKKKIYKLLYFLSIYDTIRKSLEVENIKVECREYRITLIKTAFYFKVFSSNLVRPHCDLEVSPTLRYARLKWRLDCIGDKFSFVKPISRWVFRI